MFNIQKEQLNEISKIIWTNINITKTLNKKLKEIEIFKIRYYNKYIVTIF